MACPEHFLYDYNCAACRDERAAEVAEEQTSRIEDALAAAAEQQRWATANAWKLQSATKIQKATALHESGLYDEALKLTLDAIGRSNNGSGDPSNIDGFLIAAACLESLGKPRDALPLYEIQVKLLDISEYRAIPSRYYQVLKSLPENNALLNMWITTMNRHIETWPETLHTDEQIFLIFEDFYNRRRFDDAVLILKNVRRESEHRKKSLHIGCLIAKELEHSRRTQDATTLFKWLFKAGLSRSEADIACSIAKERVNLGYEQAAQELIDMINRSERTTLGQADLMDACRALHQDSMESLSYFMQGLYIESDLGYIEREIAELQTRGRHGDISAETIAKIMNVLVDKYGQCRAQIEKNIYRSVVCRQHILRNRWILACIVFVAWMLLAGLEGAIFDFREDISPSGGSILGTLLGALLIGYVIIQLIRRLQMRRRLPIELEAAFADRNKTFRDLGLPPITPVRRSLWSPLLLYVSIMGIYLVIWFVLVMREAAALK